MGLSAVQIWRLWKCLGQYVIHKTLYPCITLLGSSHRSREDMKSWEVIPSLLWIWCNKGACGCLVLQFSLSLFPVVKIFKFPQRDRSFWPFLSWLEQKWRISPITLTLCTCSVCIQVYIFRLLIVTVLVFIYQVSIEKWWTFSWEFICYELCWSCKSGTVNWPWPHDCDDSLW